MQSLLKADGELLMKTSDGLSSKAALFNIKTERITLITAALQITEELSTVEMHHCAKAVL